MTDAARQLARRSYEAAPTPEAAVAIVTSWKRQGFQGVAPPQEVLTAAWLAGGGRDPRREPAPGDEVEKLPTPRSGTWVWRSEARMRQVWRVVEVRRAVAATRAGKEVAQTYVGRDMGFFDESGPAHMRRSDLLLVNWKRATRHYTTVLKIACEACSGSGRPRLPVTIAELQQQLHDDPRAIDKIEVHVPFMRDECPACGGTGSAV